MALDMAFVLHGVALRAWVWHAVNVGQGLAVAHFKASPMPPAPDGLWLEDEVSRIET